MPQGPAPKEKNRLGRWIERAVRRHPKSVQNAPARLPPAVQRQPPSWDSPVRRATLELLTRDRDGKYKGPLPPQ